MGHRQNNRFEFEVVDMEVLVFDGPTPATCRVFKCAPQPTVDALMKRYRVGTNEGKETLAQTFDVTSHH